MLGQLIHFRNRCGFLLVAMLLAPVTRDPVAHAASPPYVDLRHWQTSIKSQHGNNCFIYATVAALEARLKREGRGDLDLSEAFSDYMGALFFLESCEMDGRYRTSRMRVPLAGERETSLAVDYQPSVESGTPCIRLRIPEERYFPSVISPHPPVGPSDSAHPHWSRQFDVSTHNLDPRRLPRSAVEAPLYYGIEEIAWLPREDAAKPEALERLLAEGNEIIWDFKIAGDQLSNPWRYTEPADPMGPGHRMLIVGYDRRDRKSPYFIVKNSWGPTTNEGAQGFTCVGYDFIKYGEGASYITRIRQPAPWPELKYIGRWNVRVDDRQGLLDIYHLPGLMRDEFTHHQYLDGRGVVVRDQRLGMFYEDGDPSRAFHVNGNASAGLIQLWIDFDRPTRRWDELTGTKIELRRVDAHTLAGAVIVPSGRRNDASASLVEFNPPVPYTPEEPGDPIIDASAGVPADVRQAFMTAWQKEGGAQGALGKAVSDIFSPGNDAWMQVFEKGKITHSAFHGATVILN